MRRMKTSLQAAAVLATYFGRGPVTLGTSTRYRQTPVSPPTPEQLAERERDEWNKQVDARKAAKKGSK